MRSFFVRKDDQPLAEANGPLAHLVEHIVCNDEVVGSSPTRSTTQERLLQGNITFNVVRNVYRKAILRSTVDLAFLLNFR